MELVEWSLSGWVRAGETEAGLCQGRGAALASKELTASFLLGLSLPICVRGGGRGG